MTYNIRASFRSELSGHPRNLERKLNKKLLIILSLITVISLSIVKSVPSTRAMHVLSSDCGNIHTGAIKLELTEDYVTKARQQYCEVEGVTKSGTVNSVRKVVFQTQLRAIDDAWWHGADYWAEVQLYKYVGGYWELIDSYSWFYRTTNTGTVDHDDWSSLNVEDTLGLHEPSANYRLSMYGKIGQSGPGYDEDDGMSYIYVNNPSYEPYQQEVHIDTISPNPPLHLGETFHVWGHIDTLDHQGEPVSYTRLTVKFEPNKATERYQSVTTTTDSNGDWGPIEFQVPLDLRALGEHAKVIADEDAKSSSYRQDGDWCTVEFSIEPRVDQQWFQTSITPIMTRIATAGQSVQYTVLVTSIRFAGTVTLSALDLPIYTTASFSPNPVTVSANSTTASVMTISTSHTSSPGRYRPTVSGSGGSQTSQTKCILKINAPSVGGYLIPVDKSALLAPHIGLTLTILVAAVATAIHVKRTRHIKKLTRVALLMLLAGTLSIVLSVTSVKASVSLTIDPQKASVGTSAVIWIWTGDGSIRIPKGDFTVTDPNGKVSTFNKDLEFSDTAVGITYPDDPNWSPAGSVNTVGTYTVKVKTYSLEKTFERTKNEKSVGGIWFPVNKLTLLAPYIGFASTILIATAVTALYVKSVNRRKEKQ